MEKLMQYVEQMQKEGINVCRPQVQQYDILYMILISKHYPLIKWLVENNKIDYSKVDTQNWNNLQEELDCRLSDKIIMLLSIQDEPIDFLISILN